MRKLWIPVLIILIFSSMPLYANEHFVLDWEGKVSEKITYNHTMSQWDNLLSTDLKVKMDYEYSMQLFLNPKFTLNSIIPDTHTTSIELKEGYIDLYLENIDLRLGKQTVSWGSGFKLNPTSKVNPLDLASLEMTGSQLAVNALKGDYYLDWNTIITAVIVGQFVPATIPESFQTANQTQLQNIVSQQLLNLIPDSTTVEMLLQNLTLQTTGPEINDFKDLEYAFKLTHRDFYGYDLSLSYFSGYEDFPTLNSDLASVIQKLALGQPASLNFTYKPTQTIGFDLIGEFQGMGIWSETAFSINQDKQKTIETVFGGDYTFTNNLYAIVQYYHRNQLESQQTDQYVMLHLQLPLRQIHQLNTTLLYDIDSESILFNPELAYSLQNNLSLTLGGTYVTNSANTTSSLLSNYGNTQTYLGLSYGF